MAGSLSSSDGAVAVTSNRPDASTQAVACPLNSGWLLKRAPSKRKPEELPVFDCLPRYRLAWIFVLKSGLDLALNAHNFFSENRSHKRAYEELRRDSFDSRFSTLLRRTTRSPQATFSNLGLSNIQRKVESDSLIPRPFSSSALTAAGSAPTPHAEFTAPAEKTILRW
jgi:hypothetical protein